MNQVEEKKPEAQPALVEVGNQGRESALAVLEEAKEIIGSEPIVRSAVVVIDCGTEWKFVRDPTIPKQHLATGLMIATLRSVGVKFEGDV